ncbi:hypothetical protein [Streptomyces sp. T028]|uniref:hypothetical protein n=1 Tax=Streptomyces sp. T028 TaxID=3394379 RepID=UPI003A8771A5
MLHALSESGQVAAGSSGGVVFVVLVALLIWANSGKKTGQAALTKRSGEIEAILRSWTPEDRALCHGVLDKLDAEDAAKNKRL